MAAKDLTLSTIIDAQATAKAQAMTTQATQAAAPGFFDNIKIDNKFIENLMARAENITRNLAAARQAPPAMPAPPVYQEAPAQAPAPAITADQVYHMILAALPRVRGVVGDVNLSTLETVMQENPVMAKAAIKMGMTGQAPPGVMIPPAGDGCDPYPPTVDEPLQEAAQDG